MAHSTLPLHSPDFFHSRIAQAALIDSQILAVDRVLLRFNASELDSCDFVFDESCGPAAGLCCREKATIFHLSHEREYCAKHFRGQEIKRSLRELEVSRG